MKKRVYELAKEYGLDGPVLASKLRELGFDKVKTHMAVLDEFDIMMIQARLEASGLVPEKAAAQASAPAPATTEEEKPKKKKATRGKKGAAEEETKAAEEEAAPAVVEKPSKTEKPAKEEAPVVAEEKPAPKASKSKATAAAPEKTEAEAPAEPAKKPEPEKTKEKEAPVAAKPAATPTPSPKPSNLPPPKPAPPRRTATILGRIDPSLLAAKTPPKEKEKVKDTRTPVQPPASATPAVPKTRKQLEEEAQAHQLKNKGKKARVENEEDIAEALAEVHPTFLHDPLKALTRGDLGNRQSLTASQLRGKEEARYQRRRDARRGKQGGRDEVKERSATPPAPITAERKSKISLISPVTVKSFSIAIGIRPADLIRKLMNNKIMATMNTALDDETIHIMAMEYGQDVEVRRAVDAEQALMEDVKATTAKSATHEKHAQRPPIIAFLGHVDHGKTSLLDAIRESNVTEGEAGGITQHIGAYQIKTAKGETITILDTPGHEAFTAMRARGAKTTDMVILVVAADDGVMPQTLEAINHAKAAKVPIIIALNKIDKADANPQKARQQLASSDLAPEDWGGSTGIVETSATKNIGIQALLDRVLLEAEVLELKANPERTAIGTVLEASISEGKGIIAHLLVQDGTLKRGDVILAGTGYGRVRNLYDDKGHELETAGPSTPVEVIGLSALPEASDKFYIVEDLAQAREVAEARSKKIREAQLSERPAVSLENLFDQIKAGATKEIQVILKTDMQGSLEAIKKELETLKGKEIGVRLLHAAVGGINESDVDLATSSDAILLGFHVVPEDKARQKADRQKVEIRSYQIIYQLIDDVKKVMEGMLKPSMREAVLGHATIRQVFRSSRFGNIAGSFVNDGTILRSNPVRLIRNSIVIFSGKLASLKRIKDDVREVKAGFECGLKIADYEDIKEGDVIESYEVKEEKRTLE